MELLVQATIIMVLGMAVTSAFIGIVIAGVNLSARIIRRAESASQEKDRITPLPGASPDHGRIIAALTAAMLQKPRD